MRTPVLLLCLLLGLSFVVSGLADDARYVGLTRDGRRLEAESLDSWPLGLSKATFAGRAIYEGSDALRWLGDQASAMRPAGARLLLDNGDVLCGEIGELAAEDELTAWTSLAMVAPSGSVRSYDSLAVPVRFDCILRILAQPRTLAAKVGELVLRDGRRMEPRSFRASKYGATLLTAAGVVDVAWSDIADWWIREHGRTLAVAADAATVDRQLNRVARITTADGTVITSGLIFQETERDRKRRRTQRIFYYLQPAWSLSPIGVAGDEIAGCSLREPQELPLSLLDARTIAAGALTSSPRAWQRNANTSGNRVVVDRLMGDLAIGMRSHTQVAFALPPGAQAFTTYVGIERTAAGRGCATCAISGADEQTLWREQYLRSSSGVREVKGLSLRGRDQLRLEVDYAHEGRPSDADPLDIGDEVAWLMPLVSVDPASLHSPAIAARWLAGVQAWPATAAGPIVPRWNARVERWEPALDPEKEPLRLQRSLAVAENNSRVELHIGCLADPRKYAVRLLVDGAEHEPQTSDNLAKLARVAAVRKISRRALEDAPPADQLTYTWDLSSYRGRTVSLALELGGSDHEGSVAWRGIELRGE